MEYKDGVYIETKGVAFNEKKHIGKSAASAVETNVKITTSVESGVMIFELPDKKVKFSCRTQDVLVLLKESNKAFEKARKSQLLVKEK